MWTTSGYLLTLIIIQSTAVYAGLNKQMAGPYDIVLHGVDHCIDEGTKEFSYDVKLKKVNRTSLVMDMNVTAVYGIDDHTVITANVAQFTNGGWKDNFFVKSVGGMCTGMNLFVPKFSRDLFKAAGYKNCPLKPGKFNAKNFVLQLDVPAVPLFFYNKYRLDAILERKSKRIGCLSIFGDVVPKKRGRSG